MPGTEQYTLPVVHQADREEHEENLKCVKGRNYSHMSHKYWRALILSLFSLPLLVSFLLPPVSRYIIGALHTAHLPVISEGTSGLYEQWKSGFQLFTCWSFASPQASIEVDQPVNTIRPTAPRACLLRRRLGLPCSNCPLRAYSAAEAQRGTPDEHQGRRADHHRA